jgi:flagellar motor switch protein FliG
MIYYIYDELGMIRQVKSKTEAQYLVSLRPEWKIVAKKINKSVFKFEVALF